MFQHIDSFCTVRRPVLASLRTYTPRALSLRCERPIDSRHLGP